MTVVLGSTACGVLGCHRQRHVSASGLRYGTCVAHARALLTNAFGDSTPSAGSEALPPASSGAGPVHELVGVAASPISESENRAMWGDR